MADQALLLKLGENGERFLDRSQDWMNVLNADSGFAQQRKQGGRWIPKFDPGSGAGFAGRGDCARSENCWF